MSRSGGAIDDELIRELSDEYDATPIFIKAFSKHDDFKQTIRQALSVEPEILVAAGGDGTIRIVAETMLNETEVPLLVWPTGTANILAKNLGLSPAAEDIFALIHDGETAPLHLGLANDRVFAVGAAIGISTTVFENLSDERKSAIGSWAYLAQGVVEFGKHKPFQCIITTPQGDEITFDSHQVTVLNGDFRVHEMFNVFPAHNVFKETLKIHTHAVGTNKITHVANAIRQMQGGSSDKYVRTWEVDEARIDTEPRRVVSLDAEIVTETPLVIKMTKHPINVIVPSE